MSELDKTQMQQEKFVEYLGIVKGIEENICLMETWKQREEGAISSCKQSLNESRLEYSMPKRPHLPIASPLLFGGENKIFKRVCKNILFFIIVDLFILTSIYSSMWDKFNSGKDDARMTMLNVVYFTALVAPFAVRMFIVSAQRFIKYLAYKKECESIKAKNSKIKSEYNTNQKNMKNAIAVSNNKIKYIDERLKVMRAARDKAYSINVINERYRNVVCITKLYEMFEEGSYTELTGPNGAYARLRDELRQDQQIFEQQKTNKYILEFGQKISRQLSQINSQLSGIQDGMGRMLQNQESIMTLQRYQADLLDRIEANTAETASAIWWTSW